MNAPSEANVTEATRAQQDNTVASANNGVSRKARYLLPAGGVLLIIALLGGFAPRLLKSKVAAADTVQLGIPTVSIVSPTVGSPPAGLILPAEVRPWQEASIFSRVNGYLKDWYVDIGAFVKQDQLLAEVDTPDLDHQMEQASNQAVQAKASAAIAQITNEKWQKLWKEGVVSELDADNTAANQNTTAANQHAFEENLRVLQQEVAFKRITAPFPGVITNRRTNVGDLIVANNINNEIFHIQQIDPLRIYFWLPQGNSADVKVGQSIDVVFPAPVNRTMQAKVATTSNAISPNSRTLLVELHMANPNNEIQAGSYAEVRLPPSILGTILTVPDTALLFRAQGLQVGILKPDNTIELRDIKVGRDFGTSVEVTGGLNPSDKIVNNPPDSLVSGEAVRLGAQATSSSASSGSQAGAR
ncbi:MAG TPA: efflux RND transporter periplasmic adaptor subunit [Pyrinomonadaceae bacterium]|nr:efflux RND transporter periplasmic adaptor subunit [Pyrinomonadaceae bacterium]